MKMNMQTSDMEVFLRSLNQEQVDECENDENKLREIFASGWSERVAVRFHRAMLCLRQIDPEFTVGGVFEVALLIGFASLYRGNLLMDGTPPKEKRKRGVRVVGVPGNRHGRAGVSIKDS